MIKPLQVFCCYAREDHHYLLALKKHLSLLQRQGTIDVWHDRDINAGTEWANEINKQLNTAQLIFLLVSPAFMDSEYCYSKEMTRAMARYENAKPRA